jgi:signal transduction histidine kinase
MYALPVVIVRDEQARFFQGILFQLPPELQTKYQMDWYANRVIQGWSRCPQGYNVFVAFDQSGDKYIIPGLTIAGEKRPTKRFYKEPHFFTRDDIVKFSESLMQESERLRKAKDEDVRDLIHDLRALSSAIYNSATAARDEYDIGQTASARDRIETVIATQTMLSIRIDLLDYLSSQITLAELERIEVYRKVDKVVRCFRPKANFRRITLDLRGPSFGATYGPAIFELVPYSIIDNAVKYAPDRSDVIVAVEDKEKEIVVSVASLGPLIESFEQQMIFDEGYRGAHAMAIHPAGTGIGLHTTRELLKKHFGGNISVIQDTSPTRIGRHTYFSTRFDIALPRYSVTNP